MNQTHPAQSHHEDPQNPHGSFIVAASAGSGKTFQLSKRFLHLVAAGASPSGILTVTFTKKAAAEMRGRILSEAARLTSHGEERAAFDAKARAFWKLQTAGRISPPPPLAAELVGRKILEQSQLLPITTIDSLLTQWVSKFTLEASPKPEDGRSTYPQPYRLLDPYEAKAFDELAWWATCRVLQARWQNPDAKSSWPLKEDLFKSRARIQALMSQASFIWYLEEKWGVGLRPFSIENGLEQDAPSDSPDIWDLISADILEIAQKISNPSLQDKIRSSAAARDFELLLDSGIITKSAFKISGTYVRGKNRDILAESITRVEAHLRSWINSTRLRELNKTGSSLYEIYQIFSHARNELKFRSHFLEFNDLSQGAYRLFYGDQGGGIRFLLCQTLEHIMLDEFQDTSRLQWAIFKELQESLLANPDLQKAGGKEGPRPSVFIVGDPKQSIYGFREADPEVLDLARESLSSYAREIPLATSYRTTPVVLEFINALFESEAGDFREDSPLGIKNFPRHSAATASDGRLLTPKRGGVFLCEIPPTDRSKSQSENEKNSVQDISEADVVAQLIAKILSKPSHLRCDNEKDPFQLRIFDSKTKSYRPAEARDIAVLYRSSKEASQVEQALRDRNILTHKEEERGFLKRREILDALSTLRLGMNFEDTEALATFLKSPISRYHLPELQDRTILEALWISKEAPLGERSKMLLGYLEQSGELTPEFSLKLRSLVTAASYLSPHQYLYQFFQSFHLPAVYGGQSEEKKLARANLEKLLHLVIQEEQGGCRSLLNLLIKFERMAEEDLIGMAISEQNAVSMMTIHKSKGLEFPIVFLVGCQNPWGQQDSYWEKNPDQDAIHYVGTAEDQPILHQDFEAVRAFSAERIQRECGRLLYVALTRSKQYLFITGKKPLRSQGLQGTNVFPLLEQAFSKMKSFIDTSPQNPLKLLIAEHKITFDSVVPSVELVVQYVTSPTQPGAEDEMPSGPISEVQKTFGFENWPMPAQKFQNLPFNIPHGVLIQAPSRHQEVAGEEILSVFRTDSLEPQEQKLSKNAEGILASICPRLAKAAGIWVHQGLQCAVEKTPFAPEPSWHMLAPPEYRDPKWISPFASDLEQSLKDPKLKRLLEAQTFIYAEMPLVFKKGPSIYNCVLDLLVLGPEETLHVIDYKTTRFSEKIATLSNLERQDVLRQLAEERQWDRQLKLYGEGILKLLGTSQYKGWPAGLKLPQRPKIQLALYFTSQQEFLIVS